MNHPVAVVDTNVVVAGLLTSDGGSPTAQIVDGMRRGAFPFLLSTALLAEYRDVLLRPSIRKRHGLDASEIDVVLIEIATHGIVRESGPASGAPDRKDNHLWALLDTQPDSILVTGDLPLHRRPPPKHEVVSPKEFLRLRTSRG